MLALALDEELLELLPPLSRFVVVPLGEPSGASDNPGPSTSALPGAIIV